MTPPRPPKSGDPILPFIQRLWEYVLSLRLTAGPGILLRQSSSGTIISTTNRHKKNHIPPFTVSLGKEGETYYVTVSNGRVVNRHLNGGTNQETLLYFHPINRLDEDQRPTKFPITTAQAIYLQVLEDPNGSIYGAVTLMVGSNALISTTYIPSIQPGIYYYKLAELETVDGRVRLKPFAAGSHIYHETGITCDVRLLQCSQYPYEDPPAQLLRMSFVSGKIISVGADIETRPLSATDHSTQVEHCT